MSQVLRLLLIEDSQPDADLIVSRLERAGYDARPTRVQSAAALRAALKNPQFDVIIADYRLPQFDAPAALEIVLTSGHDLPFLVVSGAIGEERAAAMMKAGAHDYVMKDNLARLAPAVARAMEDAAARRELRRAEQHRRQLEAQLLQAQKMESIGRLAGAVAHDFNNLLTVISGYAHMGLSESGTTDSSHDAFVQIADAARRAGDLAGRLLAFSRPKPVETREIALNDLVRNFEKMLAPMLGKNIRLELRLDAGGGTLRADPNQIEQIIMNLAVNARDAMPDGGRLSIETSMISEARQVQLRVADTGTGIPPEVMKHIFEPFFTTKSEGVGTGLGLATVYAIVKQAHGSIEVASEPGRGTTFTLRFPASGWEAGDRTAA